MSVERTATEAIGSIANNGGYPKKCVTLVGGEPGTGKSTMMLNLAAHFQSTLYIAAEESSDEIRTRATRLEVPALMDTVEVVECQGDITIEEALEGPPCELVVLDSLSGLVGDNAAASIWTLKKLKHHVTKNGSVGIAIVHATKSDFFAGRLSLQHEVDCTMVFSCTSASGRILTTVKNRHGPSGVEEHLEVTQIGVIRDEEAQAEADAKKKGTSS